MSHAAIHIVLGMSVATLWLAPRIVRAWRNGAGLAEPCGVWLVACYLAGAYALVPSVLGRVGLPASVCTHPWMNIFLFHPLVRSLHPGGKLVGSALITVAFALQYLLLLGAIAWRRKHPCTHESTDVRRSH